MNMRKIIALLLAIVMVCGIIPFAALADGETVNAADFDTIVTSNANGDSGYKNSYTTTNGWVTEYSAIQTGTSGSVANPQFPVIGPDNTHKAVCMNGKTSATGKITSPTLTGGISKLTVNYTKMFTDTKLSATVTITDLATGTTYTHTIAREEAKDTKYVVWTDEWVLDTPITGDFTIAMVNDCPSGQDGNKDRMTILDIMWEPAPEAPAEPTTATYVMNDYELPTTASTITDFALDDKVSISVGKGTLKDELLRVYANQVFTLHSTEPVSTFVITCKSGNTNAGSFYVEISEDGTKWTRSHEAVEYPASTAGEVTLTVNFETPVNYFRFIPNPQLRVRSFTLTFGAGSTTPEEPTPSEPTPSEPTPSEPVTPEEPETPVYSVVDTPVAGTAYKFGMIQGNVSATDVFYLKGGMNGYYMDTNKDVATAIDVYLEETEGGYYMYTMDGENKLYINMVVSGTHVNGAYEAAASTVYTYNADKKTVIAVVNGEDYWFGTRNDKTYTTVGPVKVSYEGFYCQFYAVAATEPEQPEQPEEPKVPETLAEQIEEANKLANGEYLPYESTITGTITDDPKESSYTPGSYKFTVTDGTNTILCYYTPVTGGVPAKGDAVTVTGKLTAYEGAAQFDSTASAVVTKSETPENPDPEVPETPEDSTGATITFDDTSKRTEYTNEVQVWTENGITVTNTKAPDGRSNIGDYFKPARFYATTSLKIEYAGMTKLVINCDDSSKDSTGAIMNSLATVEGITVTKDGEAVIIEFAAPVDSLLIESMAGQARVFSMTAYGTGSTGGETPDPEQPEQPEQPKVPETLAEQIEEANKLANGEYLPYESTITGTIIDDPIPSSRTEGQYKFTVTDGTNTILCYYTPVTGGVPAKGDAVTVTGKLTAFGNKAQFDETASAVVTKSETPENPENPENPEVPENPETPEVPETPAFGVVAAPEAGTGYKFGMVQENVDNKIFYLAGGMNGYYMETTDDINAAIDVYLEETEGGYYLYTIENDAKVYINMVVSADGMHVNGAYEATASTVYTYDAEKKTVITVIDGEEYWFGTRNDRTYTTVGPVKVSYEGFYCQFYAQASETPEQPEQPGTGDQSPETSGVSITAMAILSVLSGSALVLLKKKEF